MLTAVEFKGEDKYIDARGVLLEYVDWGGEAPILVCLHGAGGNAHNWDWLAAALQGKFRVIALHHRGHGTGDHPPSPELAENVAGFVDTLGLDQFNLLGQSLGARVAMIYAGQHSHKIRRLALSDPPHYPVEKEVAQQLGELEGRPERFSSKVEAMEFLRHDSLPGHTPSDAELEDRIALQLVQQPDGGLIWRVNLGGVLGAMAHLLGDIRRYIPTIFCPTLLLRGERSHLLSAEDAQRTAATIPNCTLLEIKGAGHGIPRDQPEVFLNALRTFFLEA